jgi:TolB-like protein
MTDIFISYARSSERTAAAVQESLAQLGYAVWRDDALPIHRSYPQVIEERLKAAKAVVVLWSKDAAASDWVRAEADVARADGKLVQVSLDATLPPIPFIQIQCGDLAGWSGDPAAPAWRKLIASLTELVGSAPREPLPTAAPSRPLVAVLPFDNLSGDADFLWFSDGVSEEILQTVARTTDLPVIGRGSSFQFRGPAKAAANVGRELKATHVLDGSVRRSGDRLRIAANLVECASQTTLWSDRFDRDLTDVLALQDEIASAVAAALNTAFAPVAPAAPVKSEAYDLYLQARGLIPYDFPTAVPLLERATSLEPQFAPAWALLARALAAQGRFATGGGFPAPARAAATEAAQKALALDPKSAQALAALSLIEAFGRYAERERLLQAAIAADPGDPAALQAMAFLCLSVGRARDAFGFAATARELDPLSPRAVNVYEVCLAPLGLWDEVTRVCDAARARWPDVSVFLTDPLQFAAYHGRWAEHDRLAAIAGAIEPPSQDIADALYVGRSLRAPTPEARERVMGLLQHRLSTAGTITLSALIFGHGLGLRDEMFALVEQGSFGDIYDAGSPSPGGRFNTGMIFFMDPGLSRDRRFPRLCAKLGLCDYWTATDRWPDCADQVPYDFRAEARRLAGGEPAGPGAALRP